MLTFYLSRTVCNILGNIYPAYETYRAVISKDPVQHKQWLSYWVINTLFVILELFADNLISWLPLYYEAKIAFVVWLTLPRFRGATILYDKVVHQYMLRYEPEIDAGIDRLVAAGGGLAAAARQEAVRHVREHSRKITSAAVSMLADAAAAGAGAAAAPAPGALPAPAPASSAPTDGSAASAASLNKRK